MNVRIGNDIRLNVTLRGKKNFDATNIKSLKCYFINTSICDYQPVVSCCDNMCHNHCCCSDYHHTCGRPCYHTLPACCAKPCGHLKYPFTPNNPAYGEAQLPPNYGHCCECKHKYPHCDHDNYCRYGFMDRRAKCHHHHCDCEFDCCYMKHCCEFMCPHIDEKFRFLAPSKILSGKNKIQVYFPACDQYMCGDYKLVIVMTVFESGWGHCDLHTYTMDYGTVVTIVDDDSAIDGDIVIDVDNDSLVGGEIDELESKFDEYFMLPGTKLSVGEKDYYNHLYSVMVTLRNGGVTEFNPSDWAFENPIFESSRSEIQVDRTTGEITAINSINSVITGIITMKDKTGKVQAEFKVTVLGIQGDYIGFSSSDDVNVVKNQLNDSTFRTVTSIFGTHHLETPDEGVYLWIVSRTPIADSNSTTSAVKSSMFDVPLAKYGDVEYQQVGTDGLYYYHCPNALKGGIKFDITVEP